MKKKFFLLLTPFILNTAYSQLLYSDNFDKHSIGNLGTDFTGITSGQWGWHTASLQQTQANSVFTIIEEPLRGKILDVTAGVTDTEDFRVFKKNLHYTINSRSAGNEVFMFEIDYFTGPIQPSTVQNNKCSISLLSEGDPLAVPMPAENLATIIFDKTNGTITGTTGLSDVKFADEQNDHYSLPYNTWVKLEIYLDFPNKKVYFHIPLINKVFAADFLKNNTSTNILKDYYPSTVLLNATLQIANDAPLIYSRNRFDEIKLSAINAMPNELVTLTNNEQLAQNFNVFPNPATDLVTITNNENMTIQQVSIYDITGKQLSTQAFSNETQLQLDVKSLSGGTYMLHLKTEKGTTVKKLIKK